MANETQTFDPIRDLSDEDLNALAIADPSFDISTGKTKAEAPAFNPIKDLSAEDLSDLASKDPSFDISTEFFAVPDLHGDPALVQKVADARNIVRKRGFQWEDMPSLSVAASSVAKVAEGLGKQIWNYASGVGNVVQGAIADVVGARDFASESINEASRLFAENIAGTEEAVTGFSQLGGKIVGKALRGAGISKSLDELTPEERVADLWADVGKAEIRQQRLAGQGPFSMAVTGGASADANLDPEDVAIRAAGDPFSFYLFGAAGKLAGAAVPLTVRTAVSGATQAATKAAGTALRVGGGKVVEGIGKAVGGTAGLVEKAAPIVTPITGAVKGGALFGPPGVLGGLAAGQQAGKAIAGIAKSGYVRRPAASIADFGKQVASSEPVRSAYAQAGRDFLQTLPGATFDVAKGTALDIGLAAASAETPADTEGAIGFGTVLGGLQGAAKIGGRVLSGQLIAPREYGVSTPQPSSNSFRALDALHDEAFATAAPGVQARLNAMRQFLSGVAPGADLFFSDNPAKLATALEPAGLSPEQAKTWSAQNGFFSVALRDDAGKPRRVVVVTRPDSAPHEALHIIQDVIGEPGNQAIDQLIKESYAEQWNQIGEDYANRMGAKPGDTWQETILDVSGKGSTMAKEKLYRETRNKLEAEQGAVPNPKLVTEIATEAYGQLMDDAVKNNPHLDPNEVGSKVWRDILKDSPEDINVSADTYIAREIAADTFDAVFKHTGPSLGDPNSLLSKLARIAGRVVTAFGGEPLSGRAGGLSGTRLSTLAVEAVSKTAKGLVPGGTREAPPTVGRVPTSPVEEAATASNLAAAAPEFPTERGTMSQREMLGKVAESIAGRDGVRINYLSAPGEPAAATTSNRATRRAIIEEYRSLPQAARVFGEKTFFPERVRKTKNGKYQVFGWAPEVFAANAHKMAGFLVSHPEFSPYALDPAANTFTPAAWQELYKDTQTYVQNQKTGHTGSGEPLVVPKSMTERGFTAPPLRAGQALPLDQNKADFINLLFHAKLPETPRIQKGKTPLNVAGQEVSVATIPGRVEVPVRPRGEYTGAEAERQGIAGREIAEVNPLRNQIEAAALADKKPMPSLIEANQMLNLENIKELELAPEQPEFRANTLTLQAGFDPKAAMESLKNLPDAEWREQIGNYKGKFGSGLTGWAFEIGSQAKTAEDLQAFRSTGEFLSEAGRTAMKARQFDKAMPLITRSQAASEAFEAATGTKLDGTPKDTAKFIREHYDPTYEYPMPDAGRSDSQAQFDPKSAMEENKNLSDTEWQEKIGNHTGKFGSGFTGWAFEIGSQAKTAEDLQAFRSTAEFLSEAGTTAMKTGQFDKAMQLISRSQAAKESYEAATGTKVDGTAKDVAKFIREHYDPAYEYPMPSKSNTGDKSAQFDWKVFEDDSRGTEFSTIRSGASIGQTFNRDGSVWDRGEEQVDVVTLANLKMPQDMLTSEAFVEALKPYRKLLEESAVKVSVFSFTEDGNLMVSLDINAIVPQEFRDNSMKFAKANDQTMIWDAVNNDSVATGGKGEAKLTKPKEMLEALDSLVAGRKADVAQIKRKHIEDPSFITAASGGKAKAPGELPFSRMRSPVREEDEDKEAQFEPPAEETEEFPFSKVWTLPNGDPILQSDAQGMKSLPFAQFEPKSDDVQAVATAYALKAKINYNPKREFAQVPEPLLKRISDFYEKAKDTPDDPAVAKSYRALAKETTAQYQSILEAGYTIEPYLGKGEPYKNSAEMMRDVRENKHLFYLQTEKAGDFANNNAMLADSGIDGLPVNDIFRAVHDFFGHAKEGYQFGPRGEFNAWKAHSEMYSSLAQGALASETLAQNAFVNFGPHMRTETGAIRQRGEPGFLATTERPFAEQKNVVVPQELIADARGAQFDPKAKGKVKRDLKLKEGAGLFSKAWILPNNEPVQLGGTWHHDWLSKNPEVAKRYGLEIPPFEGGDAEGVRESALKKGFVRVNYGKNNGELTVEARAKDWRGKKDVVQDLIEKNLGRIDRVRVTLLDEKAAGVVDSMTSSLFNLDTNAEKMEAIPFITTGEIRGAQFDPQGFKDEDFPVALKRIRSGQESGQTFNTDGTVWNRGEDLVDIVTLASVNVPQGKLTPETFKKALAPFSDLLEEAGIKAGVFSFSQDGNPMVSIDVNAVVPQEFRKNSVDFARANDQIAIWDAVNNKTIDAGGKGNTQLTKPNEMLDAVDSLRVGRKVDVAEIKRQYAEDTTGAKEEQGTFFGGGKEYVGNAAVANMTKAELAKNFPEVLIPRRRTDSIPSAIVDSPLYKQAGGEAKAVEAFARRLVEFANEYKDDPAFKAGVEWYSKFVPKLKKEFGKDAQIMAELLAATSPQTNVQVNFAYAFDALQSLKAGRFDGIIPKFNEGLGLLDSGKWEAEYGKMRDAGEIIKPPANPTPAAFLEGWINKYNLKPRQSNGALYGAHSIPVLQVFARKWLTESRGPKTLNFVKNLMGQGHGATIDLWADRTMRRVGYSGFVDRWRILPGNVQAVSAADFSFAQKAFSRAAEQLDMKPDAFQGGLWLAEKKLWHDKGWGRLDLGDFQIEMKKIPALRKRYQQRMAVTDRGPVEQTPDLFAVEPRFAPR